MFAKSIPPLLVTIDDSSQVAEQIQKGGFDSASARAGMSEDSPVTGLFVLEKAAKLFPEPQPQPQPEPYVYEPDKRSIESNLIYGIGQLKELRELSWSVESLGRQGVDITGVKKVLEARFQRLQADLKSCVEKHGKAKKSEDSPELQKAMSFIIQLGQPAVHVDPAEAELKGTHGEQFHSDADRQVVEYLTTVEKVDLKHSPTHNPVVVPGNPAGVALSKASAALDALDKAFDNEPPKPGAKVKKPPKDPEQVRQEKQQARELGVKKSIPIAARIASLKRRRGLDVLPQYNDDGTRKAMTSREEIEARIALFERDRRPAPDLDRDALMAKGLGWEVGT